MTDNNKLQIGSGVPWKRFTIIKDVKETAFNNAGTLANLMLTAQNISTSEVPCRTYKIISDMVCGYYPEKYKSMRLVEFGKVRTIVKQSMKLTKSMKRPALPERIVKQKYRQLSKKIDKLAGQIGHNKESIICTISKHATHRVCTANDFLKKALIGDFKIGSVDFRKYISVLIYIIEIFKEIAFNEKTPRYRNSIDKLYKGFEKLDVLNNLADKTYSSKKIKNTGAYMYGGSSDNYDYIIDPSTNQHVSVHTVRGRHILQNFVSFNKCYDLID